MKCTSKKKQFDSEKKANEWVLFWNIVVSDNKNFQKLTYSYLCPECGMWHTTKNAKVPKNKTAILTKKINEQNKDFQKILNDILNLRTDMNKVKKVLHDRENHLQALLKTNKLILEKLKEM